MLRGLLDHVEIYPAQADPLRIKGPDGGQMIKRRVVRREHTTVFTRLTVKVAEVIEAVLACRVEVPGGVSPEGRRGPRFAYGSTGELVSKPKVFHAREVFDDAVYGQVSIRKGPQITARPASGVQSVERLETVKIEKPSQTLALISVHRRVLIDHAIILAHGTK